MDESMKKKLTERILAEATEEGLSCPQALAIAAELACDPAHLGRLCDELKVKLYGCQLGCF